MLGLKGGRIMDLFHIILSFLIGIFGGFELFYIVKFYKARDLYDMEKYLKKLLLFSVLLLIVSITCIIM